MRRLIHARNVADQARERRTFDVVRTARLQGHSGPLYQSTLTRSVNKQSFDSRLMGAEPHVLLSPTLHSLKRSELEHDNRSVDPTTKNSSTFLSRQNFPLTHL